MSDENQSGVRVSVIVHEDDNVATALDHQVDWCLIAGGVAIVAGIPFGHKIALTPIAKGDSVVKYGVVIGHATQDIRRGDHVHVHNVR